MKNAHLKLMSLFLLMGGFAFPAVSLAQEMVIDLADPASGEQGASNYAVDIIGSGFDETVTEVRFILNCGKKNCPDTGDIVVNQFNVETPTRISTNINILENAAVAKFDIAVRSSRGRGGKGTTYFGLKAFTVKVRPNQDLASCTDVFAPLGTCDCLFVHDVDGGIYNPVGDCSTSETLYVNDKRIHNGDPNNPFVLTAQPDGSGVFHGTSVIANGNLDVAGSGSHRGGVRGISFEFIDVPRGCGPGELRAAISLVLDYPMVADPRIPDPLGRNAFLRAWESTIQSDDDPLCYGIEVVRTQAYSDAYSAPGDPEPARDWKTITSENVIAPGSYVRAGIRYLGIMPSETINPPAVTDNVIGAPACDEADTAAAIEFGSFVAVDPLEQVEGVVENNVIDMTNDCVAGRTSYGIGINVYGEPGGSQTNIKFSKNVILGAMTAALVDANVVRINFSGNTFTGDGNNVTADTGILSAAQCTEFKGKPNKIKDFNQGEDHAGCP